MDIDANLDADDSVPTSPSSPSSPTEVDPVRELEVLLFEIQEIPGKGRGLIARQPIIEGTRILCEKPFLLAGPMPVARLESFLGAQLKSLSKSSQRLFFSFYNNHPGKFPFSNTFKTNALPCGPASAIGGVYPTICFINHSCIPNCHNSWDSEAEHETIYVTRPIQTGEEITIPYDHGGPSTTRRTSLKESFGFNCKCPGCDITLTEQRASDARRLQIKKLDDAIGNPSRLMKSPRSVLKDCHTLLQALNEEYTGHAGVLNARAYYDAFQVCIAHGDQARAKVCAERAYKARVMCEGEDSPETQSMKALSVRPANHASFELCSTRWKTRREMVPKGLSEEEFDIWLFRLEAGASK